MRFPIHLMYVCPCGNRKTRTVWGKEAYDMSRPIQATCEDCREDKLFSGWSIPLKARAQPTEE